MEPNDSALRKPACPRAAGGKRRAFSLVEVTLALGIVSFSCVTLIGLLSIGLNLFRHATNDVVETHIAQSLTSELQLATFSNVQSFTTGPFSQPTYYDSNGLKLVGTSGAAYVAQFKSSTDLSSSALYTASNQAMSTGVGSTVVITISSISAPTEINYFPLIMANNHQ